MNTLETKREIKSRQTREKIFDTAEQLINNHGHQYLTVKNLCEMAEISNGTFFHFFSSKEEMLLQYLQNKVGLHCESFRNYFETNLEQDKVDRNMLELVAFFYAQYAKYCVESGVEFMSIYYNVKNKFRGTRRDYQESSNKFIAKSAKYLEIAKNEGFIQPDISTMEVGEDLVTLAKGAIFEWCTADGAFDLEKLITKMVRIYLNGIVSDKYKELYGRLRVDFSSKTL